MIYTDQMEVVTTRVEGEDLDIARAAWVSTKGERAEDEVNPTRGKGLINMLMRDRHGSPYEQVGFQFMVSAPLFVWREHYRHRMFSYNEESGRYKKLEPKFYIPNADRALIQQGKPGAYEFVAGTDDQYEIVQNALTDTVDQAYANYEAILDAGVAKEVARMALPLNIYSTAYVRGNLRSLMNFLSLRTKDEDAAAPSFPQYEIELLAREYEKAFAEHFPWTYEAFCKHGRVSP